MVNAARNVPPERSNVDLEVLRRILDYACKHGMMLDNTAKEITRRKLSREKIIIPTKDQFRQLLETMRKKRQRLRRPCRVSGV